MKPWPRMMSLWVTELRAAGRSANTIRLYRYNLTTWAKICPSPGAATHDLLVAWLGEEDLSPEYRKSRRTAVVAFYRWAHQRGHLRRNPATDLPSVHVPPPNPRPADDSAIVAAIRSAPPRVRLMVQLGAIGGLRRAEISQVHSGHLRESDDLIVVGKGGRARSVPLPWQMAFAVREANGWVFPGPLGHLTAGHVGKLITAWLPDGVTPHQLRHAAASAMHDQGLSLLELREFLGHASVATTQRYVRIRSTRLRAAALAAAGRLAS